MEESNKNQDINENFEEYLNYKYRLSIEEWHLHVNDELEDNIGKSNKKEPLNYPKSINN